MFTQFQPLSVSLNVENLSDKMENTAGNIYIKEAL